MQAYEGRNWDWPRTAIFTVFGVYTGLIYGKTLAKTYPWLMSKLNVRRSISGPLVEGCYYIPFLYFPGFYVLQEMRSPRTFSLLSALKNYKCNITADMLNWGKFWPLPMVLAFSILPDHLIPMFVASVGFIWVLILSSSRGELDKGQCVAFDVEGNIVVQP